MLPQRLQDPLLSNVHVKGGGLSLSFTSLQVAVKLIERNVEKITKNVCFRSQNLAHPCHS